MYVVFTPIQTKNNLKSWADPSKFPALFEGATGLLGGWERQILVDDDNRVEMVNLKVSETRAFIFYAKDKETLKAGLGAALPSSTVTSENGQLGIFSGSYDLEKMGAWGENKMKAAENWKGIKAEGRAEGLKAQGLGKSDYVTFMNRQRLMKRGYFMIAASAVNMNRHALKKSYTFVGTAEKMIRALPHFVE